MSFWGYKIMGMMRGCFIFIQCLLLTSCFSLNSPSTQSRDQASASKKRDPYLPVWTAIDPTTIESVLTNQLGVTRDGGEGGALIQSVWDKKLILGDTTVGSDRSQNLEADPVKFRYYNDIFFNGCFLGMNRSEILSRYFSPGWNRESFNSFYEQTLGRQPTSSEKDVLLDLVNNPNFVSFEKQATAVCTVVLSSIEFTNSR